MFPDDGMVSDSCELGDEIILGDTVEIANRTFRDLEYALSTGKRLNILTEYNLSCNKRIAAGGDPEGKRAVRVLVKR